MDITPISQSCWRSQPGHRRVWTQDQHVVKGLLPPSCPGPRFPQASPPITSSFCSSHPHQNEPHWAGGLRELKHAIKQLLDGKCFRNFRLHLLLNLILSSDAHYAQDGISCGLPALRTPAGGSPRLNCCTRLSTVVSGIMRAPLGKKAHPGHPGTHSPASPTSAPAGLPDSMLVLPPLFAKVRVPTRPKFSLMVGLSRATQPPPAFHQSPRVESLRSR